MNIWLHRINKVVVLLSHRHNKECGNARVLCNDFFFLTRSWHLSACLFIRGKQMTEHTGHFYAVRTFNFWPFPQLFLELILLKPPGSWRGPLRYPLPGTATKVNSRWSRGRVQRRHLQVSAGSQGSGNPKHLPIQQSKNVLQSGFPAAAFGR